MCVRTLTTLWASDRIVQVHPGRLSIPGAGIWTDCFLGAKLSEEYCLFGLAALADLSETL